MSDDVIRDWILFTVGLMTRLIPIWELYKGRHVFFIHNPGHVGASFEYMLQSGSSPDMYVLICGRVIQAQTDVIKRRSFINTDDYKAILNWLINNYPSYNGM